jgi:hypothetical protein
MTLGNLDLAMKTVLPIVQDASALFMKLLNGTVGLFAAKAELRNILVIGMDRLTQADVQFAARDAKEDARVAGLVTPTESPTAKAKATTPDKG